MICVQLKQYVFKIFYGLLLIIVPMFAQHSGKQKIDQEIEIEQKGNKPLSILFVIEKFPLLSETTVLNQITGLIKRGHKVYIYATLGRGYTKKMHPDVGAYHLLDRYTYFNTLPTDLPQFDIIYCQFGPLGIEAIAMKKKYNLKAKIVTCFRGYDLSRYLKQYGSQVYDELFQEGDLFLPVCDYFKNRLIALGCPQEKIITQHSAIDLSRFTFKKREPVPHRMPIKILSVSRLVEKKGLDYTIRAMVKVAQQYPYIEYTIVGNGPLMRELQHLIRRVHMRRRIRLLGWANQDEVISMLKKSHIAIVASLQGSDGNEEGIPNAAKEAMACGVPVISTYVSGIPELIENNVSGFLVEPANSLALARKIQYLIKNQDCWERIATAARKTVEEEFDVERMNDRLVEIFYNLLEKKHE